MTGRPEVLIPKIGVVTDIRIDTPDVKTFRVVTPEGKKAFEHKPGQCAMLSIPGVGEAMFSITSSPTNEEFMEFSIKKCGCLTNWAPSDGGRSADHHPRSLRKRFPRGYRICGKGPSVHRRRNRLAPLRSVINYVRHYRDRYGKIDIVYGSRSKNDLVDYHEIIDEWCNDEGVDVHLTIDREQEGWDGHVGFVPNYVKELGFSTDKTAVLCGPPIMIKFTLAGLQELGFDKTQVYTTMELRMKCGIGKCGRCNIGGKYVCKDGPVFRCDQLDELPEEY